jgi:hypothetical protein
MYISFRSCKALFETSRTVSLSYLAHLSCKRGRLPLPEHAATSAPAPGGSSDNNARSRTLGGQIVLSSCPCLRQLNARAQSKVERAGVSQSMRQTNGQDVRLRTAVVTNEWSGTAFAEHETPPWPELYRLSDRRLSAKLVSTDQYGRNLGLLGRRAQSRVAACEQSAIDGSQ